MNRLSVAVPSVVVRPQDGASTPSAFTATDAASRGHAWPDANGESDRDADVELEAMSRHVAAVQQTHAHSINQSPLPPSRISDNGISVPPPLSSPPPSTSLLAPRVATSSSSSVYNFASSSTGAVSRATHDLAMRSSALLTPLSGSLAGCVLMQSYALVGWSFSVSLALIRCIYF